MNRWARVPSYYQAPISVDQIGESYTGKIAEEVALLSKAHAIVPKETRNTSDPRALQPIASELEVNTRRLVQDFGIECMVIIGSGNEPSIEVHVASSNPDYNVDADLFRRAFSPDLEVRIGAEGQG